MLGGVRRLIEAAAVFSAPVLLACATALQEPPAQEPEPGGPWGYGSITRGGETDLPGRPHDVYEMTNLDDDGPGSLRYGVFKRDGPRVIRVKVGGTLRLKTVLKLNKPYLTIDARQAPSPGLTVDVPQIGSGSPGIKMGATHDLVMQGIRFAGDWAPGRPVHNGLTLSVDGDSAYVGASWDPEPQACGPTPVYLRNVCRVIIDGNTFRGSEDSGPDFWCGVKDLTFSRNLIIDSYHPRGTGCKGVYPEGHQHARMRITEYANVYAYNGERQPKYNEGTYHVDLINNIVAFWQDYGSAIGNGAGGYGALWESDGAQDNHNVINNVFLPGGGPQAAPCALSASRCTGTDSCRESWDCTWKSCKCDGGPGNCETNLRADALHYSGNLFGPGHDPFGNGECVSTATGQDPFPRPYELPIHAPGDMERRVLDQVGAPHRTAPAHAREQAVVEEVRGALRSRVARR